MALPSKATTRIDQLAADLQRVQTAQAKSVTVPDSTPMFTTYPDGSVYDRKGNRLFAPVPTKK